MLCFAILIDIRFIFLFWIIRKTDNLCLVCDLSIRILGIYNMIIIMNGENKRKEKEK